jgi:hypothetical protein
MEKLTNTYKVIYENKPNTKKNSKLDEEEFYTLHVPSLSLLSMVTKQAV